jgi:hypothetical protein
MYRICTYRVSRHIFRGLGYHTVCQSAEEFAFEIGGRWIDSQEMAQKDRPEVVFSLFGEVRVETHSSL